ncbi:flavoprotein [Nocardioides zeae]|uniref:Flavoprotein n=1 Tax=Nocardioides imazamoxiresistens TaxID=3231893 RepID=A0ABU3PV85_9ACTN|nr:flavoprotein [Nocardioides zeae]MDT9593131.1 flavoprotein [Nocardioides zeae]
MSGPGAPSAETFEAQLADAMHGLDGRRVALVVTGSLSAAYLPYWLTYLSGADTHPELRVLLTRTATTMVSPTAVSALLGRPVESDAWPGDEAVDHAPHVELAEWADGFLVHPCTFSYLGRIATGLADTPAQLALQTSSAPKVVCPALPPGTLDAPAYQRHEAALKERTDVVLLPPGRGRSVTTGRQDALPPAQFSLALGVLGQELRGREES